MHERALAHTLAEPSGNRVCENCKIDMTAAALPELGPSRAALPAQLDHDTIRYYYKY